MNEKAKEVWAVWPPEIHQTEYAQKRIKSAQSAKLTPLGIDQENLCGYFQGSHGRYETFLDHCPCGDFIRARKPCKHIYRLAMELNIIGAEYKTNASTIPVPTNEKLSLDKTIDAVESLPDELQIRLLKMAAVADGNTGKKEFNLVFDNDANQLLSSGLLVKVPGSGLSLNFGTKKDLEADLQKLGLPYSKKQKVSELKEYCVKHYFNELVGVYRIMYRVSFAPNITVRNIHFYLHRKFDSETVFDGNDFTVTPLLETRLPYDKITEQLIKRGYYTQK